MVLRPDHPVIHARTTVVALRKLVDHAARIAVKLGWDLSSFCELAAKAFERHGGRPG